MAWIEYHTQLLNHWKIQRLADLLGVDYHHSLGLVSCLWLWCVDYASDGNVTRFSDAEIRRGIHTNIEKFSKEALKKCELIDEKNSINDWKHHGLKYLVSTRLRVKKHRLQKRYRNVTVTPTLPNHTLPNLTNKKTSADTTSVPIPNEPKPMTEIQKVVKGWKFLNGIPLEGDESKNWDKVHFSRCSNSAKAMIDLFGYPQAVQAMEYVFDYVKKQGWEYTFETIVKHSDKYREVMNRGNGNSKSHASLPIIQGAIERITKARA